MTNTDFTALLPLLLVSGMSVVVMLAIALRRSHTLTAALTAATLAAAFVSLWPAASAAPRQVTPLLSIDGYALFYIGLIIAASLAVTFLAYDYFERLHIQREEFYVLLLVSVLGAGVLAASDHFVSFFLGLELLSVPLFGLIAYRSGGRLSLEAGIKYLILAATSVAFLLFGIALIYADLGTLAFSRMTGGTLLLPGLVFLIAGFGFKLALVPFHLWTADVYEGAPAPVTAFISTVSKTAMFALLVRYFAVSGGRAHPAVTLVFTIVAIASMIGGTLLALKQDDVKRILAYSSIAHLGYILTGFLAGGELAERAVAYYLAAYTVTLIAAFGVVSALSSARGEPGGVADYSGLFWTRPALGIVFTGALLSLAGIPLTGGFFAKYFVLAAGASASQWALILTLVVTSGIGIYYYLRILVVLYNRPQLEPVFPRPRPAEAIALASALALVVWLGVWPAPMMRIIRPFAGAEPRSGYAGPQTRATPPPRQSGQSSPPPPQSTASRIATTARSNPSLPPTPRTTPALR